MRGVEYTKTGIQRNNHPAATMALTMLTQVRSACSVWCVACSALCVARGVDVAGSIARTVCAQCVASCHSGSRVQGIDTV